MNPPDNMAPPGQPVAVKMFFVAMKIGLMSIGGSMSAWIYRDLVLRLRWLTEKDFLIDMSLARILPGANITNVIVLIGYRLLGLRGSVVGFFGILAGPFCLLMLLIYCYERIKGPNLETAMEGAAAAAIGPMVYIAVRSAKHSSGTWYALAVLSAVTLAAILKISLMLIVAIALPVSIALVWLLRKA